MTEAPEAKSADNASFRRGGVFRQGVERYHWSAVRILHVIPYYLPALDFGGPLQVCAKLAGAMAARGHQVTLLTTDVESRSARLPNLHEVIDNVQVVRLRNLSQRLVGQNLYTPAGTVSALTQLLDSVDVVHMHEFFIWLTFRAATMAKKRNIPVVLSPHAALSVAQERGRVGIKRLWLELLGNRTVAASTVVQVANTNEAEQCVAAGVPRNKIRLISHGVLPPPRGGDAARFYAKHGLPQDGRPIILFVGRLLAGKGVDLLLAAAQAFVNHPARPLFVLAGPAENRPDLDVTGRRNGGNVLLTGRLDQSELSDAYSAASLFILPSFSEGMPISALDALAFGLPSLLSRACNLPEVAAAGAGITIDAEVSSLRTGIGQMLEQRAKWPAMAQAARKLAAERFSIDACHDRYEELYNELHQAAVKARR